MIPQMISSRFKHLPGNGRRWAISLLASLLALLVPAVYADAAPQKLALWPGPAPMGDGTFQPSTAAITLHRPAQPNGAAMVICPGGGYGGLVTKGEGHGIAEWLNQHGIAGIVLEYRLPRGNFQLPLLDAQRAIRTVRFRAKEWGIDPDRIGIIGFSAGGHLASTAGTHFDAGDPKAAEPLDRVSCRPDFMVLIYPVISMGPLGHAGSRTNLMGREPKPELIDLFSNEKQVTRQTPPGFLAHAQDDTAVPPVNSRIFYEALLAQQVPAKYLELPKGGHGLNGYKGPMWDAWQQQSLEWLETQKLVPKGTAGAAKATLPAEFAGITPLQWSVRMAESEMARRGNSLAWKADGKAKWDYAAGLLTYSLLKLNETAPDPRLVAFSGNAIGSFIAPDGSIQGYKPADFNLDNINSGKTALALWRLTGDERYRKAAALLRRQFETQPRTGDGGFWHKQRYPHQMWLDGLYMASPFYAECAQTFKEPAAALDDVAKQIRLVGAHTFDPATGLFYHGWDESREQSWADKATGRSPSFWSRAIGWYGMAMVDVLDFVPADHPARAEIIAQLQKLIAGVAKQQDPATCLWYQVTDQGALPGNYLESTASAMFVYTIAKAVNHGYASRDYVPMLQKGYGGLIARRLQIGGDGRISLTHCCQVAGLGNGRNGTCEYYFGEPIVENDLKGTGPFILAGIEMQQVLGLPMAVAVAAPEWAKLPELLARIQAPVFPDRDFPITRFGAVGGEAADASEAIRRAIEACQAAGGGRVIVPAGVFISGPIELKGNVNLHLEKGATLKFKTDPKAYLPAVATRFEGMECLNYAPLLSATGQTNVAITGEGILDGQADETNWWSWTRKQPDGGPSRQTAARNRLAQMVADNVPPEQRRFGDGDCLRPGFIEITRCRNVLIEGVNLRRSPMWVIHPLLSTNVTVRGVNIMSHGPNNDGCDPESCRDVLIEGCVFDTGDDCIAIKSGRNNDGRRVATPSENLVVRRCTMKEGHGGVVIGSEISGGCRNVFVEDCTMDSPDLNRALRFKSNAVRGGTIENVFMRNTTIGQVRDAVLQIDFVYEEGAKGPYKPVVRNVVMENVTVRQTPRILNVVGFPGAEISGVRIINSTFLNVAGPDIIKDAGDIRLENVIRQAAPPPIDRQALATRHNVVRTDANPRQPLQVGNGEFAFAADATGLQTFQGNTMAQWGWHSEPLPADLNIKDFKLTPYDTYGRSVGYATSPAGQERLYNWLRENPHRLNLGKLALAVKKADGTALVPADLKEVRQELDLWRGTLTSRYTIEGQPVEVVTCAAPDRDAVAVRIESPLVASGRLSVTLAFPYGKAGGKGGVPEGADWTRPQAHRTVMTPRGDHGADLARQLDNDRYRVALTWSAGAALTSPEPHRFMLAPAGGGKALELVCTFSPGEIAGELPSFDQTRNAAKLHWQGFWKGGGAIDLSASRDPRWKELERRIVLSQYLLAVNEAGSLPPQESGLLLNSGNWNGKFHLEMHWWHGTHYALWGRWPLFAKSLDWYSRTLSSARERAATQGYRGARWPKMVGPEGYDSPSGIGPLLIWQQPHPIFYALLDARLHPGRETLEKWREVIFATADFMAAYAVRDPATGHYVLGPPLKTVPEKNDIKTTRNPGFELSYWKFGLRIARDWRAQLGLPPEPKWDEVYANLAPLPVAEGCYLLQEGQTDTFTKWNWEHPSQIGMPGMLPGDGADPETARRTVKRTAEVWQWDRCWGWDFPMMAMAAARNGEPALAVDALLNPSFKNNYDDAGINAGGPNDVYFPGNGGLLYAVALMAAGWDPTPAGAGAPPARNAPGFPNDGSWTVKHEGLSKAP